MLSLFSSSRRVTSSVLVLIQAMPQPSKKFSSIPRFVSQNEVLREEILRRYNLQGLDIEWPKAAGYLEPVDYRGKNPNSIRQMYGDADLSALPIFQGGFINFGYWNESALNASSITQEQRAAASEAMYKVVGDLCGIMKQHSVLDVGSGLGYGTSLISGLYSPKITVGLDVSPDQIARAKKYQIVGVKNGKLRFALGEAESMPFPENSFDCVLCVEAAQHFFSISEFSKEVSRILKPGGKCVVTSFFPTNDEGVEALNAIVPDYHIHGSQHTVNEVKLAFENHMENVQVRSVGSNVWHGFSRWLDQLGYHHQWSKIWCALYEKGLIDYVIYESQAPCNNLQHKACLQSRLG